MKKIKFNTVNDFVNWLIDNEGNILFDNYGRSWKYSNFVFYSTDITEDDFEIGLRFLNLFSTDLFFL